MSMRRAREADLSELLAEAGVRVTPLEWLKHPDDPEWYSDDDPNGGEGLYWVLASKINPGEWDLLAQRSRMDSFSSADAAKAAAQRDYEQRILSALEPVAEAKAEPVAAEWNEERALDEFTAYFVKNYPGPDTIIGNPLWHAPKIFRAALYAIKSTAAPAPAADRAAIIEQCAKVADEFVFTVEDDPGEPDDHQRVRNRVAKCIAFFIRNLKAGE